MTMKVKAIEKKLKNGGSQNQGGNSNTGGDNLRQN